MKNFTVIFSPLALDDIEQAMKKCSPGLGKRFVGQLQLTPTLSIEILSLQN